MSICLAKAEHITTSSGMPLVCNKNLGHDGPHRDPVDGFEWLDGLTPVQVKT